MHRIPKIAFIGVVLLLTMACNLIMPSVPQAQSVPATAQATDTQVPAVETMAPSSTVPSQTQPVQATVTLTQAPAPAATAMPVVTPTAATPVPTPGDTPSPVAPSDNPTTLAALGPLADLMNISQYFNPVGTPLPSWHNVPVMPQAIAGQEFKADIYSYKATATLSQATTYYHSKATSIGLDTILPPATGFGGTGDAAFHNVVFRSQNIFIVLTSLDKDPQQVIVVIDKAP